MTKKTSTPTYPPVSWSGHRWLTTTASTAMARNAWMSVRNWLPCGGGGLSSARGGAVASAGALCVRWSAPVPSVNASPMVRTYVRAVFGILAARVTGLSLPVRDRAVTLISTGYETFKPPC
jgi:hypothetical protein